MQHERANRHGSGTAFQQKIRSMGRMQILILPKGLSQTLLKSENQIILTYIIKYVIIIT